MKLDSRIIEGKHPLTCFDTNEAKQFINHTGYVTDDALRFIDVDQITLRLLTEIRDDSGVCFKTNEGNYWRYFLPAEWVKEKEPEPKWRPYTSIEFAEKFEWWVGKIIRIRDRPENAGQEYEYKIIFTGYRWYKDVIEVFINGCWIDLLTLFDLYEYMEDGEWHKFGVEVKE